MFTTATNVLHLQTKLKHLKKKRQVRKNLTCKHPGTQILHVHHSITDTICLELRMHT